MFKEATMAQDVKRCNCPIRVGCDALLHENDAVESLRWGSGAAGSDYPDLVAARGQLKSGGQIAVGAEPILFGLIVRPDQQVAEWCHYSVRRDAPLGRLSKIVGEVIAGEVEGIRVGVEQL